MLKGNEKSKFIPGIIIDYFKKKGVGFIDSLPIGDYVDICDIVKYCNEKSVEVGIGGINFDDLIREALSIGYDERYYSINKEHEERLFIRELFFDSFLSILDDMNVLKSFTSKDTLVVGIGNGVEGDLLYKNMKYLSIIDIAPMSLSKASETLPQAKGYRTSSEDLSMFDDSSFDVYISLRTYQSTYFNIKDSIKEACRVLRKGGLIIISIACGYLSNDACFVQGLYNPKNGVLEKDSPLFFVDTIKSYMKKNGIQIIKSKQIPTEIFIYANKN